MNTGGALFRKVYGTYERYVVTMRGQAVAGQPRETVAVMDLFLRTDTDKSKINTRVRS